MSTTIKPLGKMTKIPLREVWAKEATHFTKWLAKEENLSILGKEIDMELELIESESSVGSFSADIYAKEVGTGKKVIIENQLEATNHDHLGKIITYAAGKDAEIIVWLVSEAREEHRNAIDWLNEHTDMEIGFFLIEMELWSIDGSNPALKFNVVQRPNNWAKTIKASNGMNDTEKAKLNYWQAYYNVAINDSEFTKVFNPHKASSDHWSTLAVGSSKYYISLLVNTGKSGKIGIEITVPDNKELGQFFIDNIKLFEDALGLSGDAYNASKQSGIRFYKSHCNIKDSSKWDEFIKWHMSSAIKFKKILEDLEIPL